MPVGEALDGGQRFLIWWLPCDFMGACATKKDKTIFFSPLIHFQLKVKSTLFYPMLLTTDNFLKKINQLAENKINITWLSISTSNDKWQQTSLICMICFASVGHVMMRTVSFRFVIFQMHYVYE